MKKLLVWLVVPLVGVLFVVAAIAAGGFLWLRGSLPQTDGTLRIAALESPVEVLRDADGLVTIRAQSTHDAAVALGYVHAQDRLWQMDAMRRTGAGRMSEVFGPATVRLDRFMRTLGLYRLAQENLAHLSAPVVEQLEAYAAGVNAFIAEPGGPWPPEFYLLRYRPERWQPADSLVWAKLMAFQLSGNWTEELLRARLARRLSPEQIDFLWPDYPADAPVALGELAGALDGLPLTDLASLLPWDLAPKDASNSWVLGGARTASGRPILANDLHLALTTPGPWYLARIETPELTLTGATAPGVPVMIAGHNGFVAWSFTTTHSDTQDLFMERLAEGDATHYLTPDGPRPFETRTETIEVRDAEPEVLTVRVSRHGPVVSDALIRGEQPTEAGTVLALAWPTLRADDATAEAQYALNRARDWPAFHAALRHFHSPQQNIVYADTGGTIAFAAPARVPIRKRGNGRAPVPGWSGDYDWSGLVPFEELPMRVDPPDARFVTANNKIVPDDYPHLLAADWPEPYRAQRITELLDAAGSAGTLEQSAAMQQDVVSPAARILVPRLLRAAPSSERGRAALSLLQEWDGRMDRDAPAPLLFYAWTRALHRALLADELGAEFLDFQRPKVDLLARILDDGHAWCDDVTTPDAEDCAHQLVDSLEAALNDLALYFHRPVERLRWGEVHKARFPHPILEHVPVLADLVAYEVETDGGDYTVNRAGARFAGGVGSAFDDVHGPTLRAVYDLADLARSRFMIPTGQSGNLFSPHYGDLAQRWRDGQYVTFGAEEEASHRRLRLVPAPGTGAQRE